MAPQDPRAEDDPLFLKCEDRATGLSVVTVLWFSVLCKAARHGMANGGEGSDASGSGNLAAGDSGVVWQLYFAPIVLFGCQVCSFYVHFSGLKHTEAQRRRFRQGASFPVFYEMSVEAAFPIAEGEHSSSSVD